MKTELVSFFSEGDPVSALWRPPDEPGGPLRAIVQGPGWLGLKDAKLYERYHQAFTGAGRQSLTASTGKSFLAMEGKSTHHEQANKAK